MERYQALHTFLQTAEIRELVAVWIAYPTICILAYSLIKYLTKQER